MRGKINNWQILPLFKLPVGFRGKPGWYVQLWWLVQSTFFGLSPQFMYGWRRWLLRLFGAKIGKKVLLRPTIRVTYPWKINIGDYTWVGDNVVLYSLGKIEIGNNVVISQKSYLCTAGHDYRKPTFDIFARKITIGDQAWLAVDVYVAPGVKIGKGSLVGARSSVFSDLPAGMICLGSPAKPVKPRPYENTDSRN